MSNILKNLLVKINDIVPLSKFKWYRAFIGGTWELWWVDFPVISEIWHHSSENLRKWENTSPTPLCKGRPIKVEVYLQK